jgi:protein arginine kinase activator
MKCQVCNKKEAIVHLTEIGDNGAVKIHLCPDCAQARGIGGLAPEEAGPAEAAAASAGPDESGIRCAVCGISLAEFRKKGRLGCGNCYQAFAEAFVPLLAAIHRGDRHVGKVPAVHHPGSAAPDLVSLKESLRTAVEKEKFEEAARLSGLIKKLERAQ